MRAWHRVPNKNGSEPPLYGFVAGTDIDIGLRVSDNGQLEIRPERGRNEERLAEYLGAEDDKPSKEALYIFPLDFDPPSRLMSRFLAKMAFEALALRFVGSAYLDMLIDEGHYDRIRHWARRGDNFDEWPYSQRQIFPVETQMRHPSTGEWVQAGFGYDLFLTKRPETYFAFCFYGFEFVINVGGPSIKGYEEWLRDNNDVSPLVERVGLKLRQYPKDSETSYRLQGKASTRRGANFDRAQLYGNAK